MNTLTLEDALLVEARHLILNDYNFRSAVNHLAVNWTQARDRDRADVKDPAAS